MVEDAVKFVRSVVENKTKPWWNLSWVVAALLIVGSIVFDIFVPSVRWADYVRAVLALVLAVPAFVVIYSFVMRRHTANVKNAETNNEDYVEWRERWSPSRRFQQSLMIGAVLAVLVIVTVKSYVYTATAGIVVALVFGLMAYCRKTPFEIDRDAQGLTDPRDDFEKELAEKREIDRQARIEIRKEQLKNAEDDDADDDQMSIGVPIHKDQLHSVNDNDNGYEDSYSAEDFLEDDGKEE